MKQLLFLLGTLLSVNAAAQSDSSTWVIGAEANFYWFTGGEQILLPVVKADYSKLHLESRYNYEDVKTFSGWVGYNISGGKKIEYTITPMVGLATGQTKGFGTGLEITLTMGKWEFYSESEHLWDRAGKEYNFFYNWTDLAYSPKDWWWVGISGQRTRLYQTKLDIQRGVLLGAAAGSWEFTGYLYNIGFDDPFVLITVAFGF